MGGGEKNEGEEERDWWNGSLKGFSSIYFMKKIWSFSLTFNESQMLEIVIKMFTLKLIARSAM